MGAPAQVRFLFGPCEKTGATRSQGDDAYDTQDKKIGSVKDGLFDQDGKLSGLISLRRASIKINDHAGLQSVARSMH